MAAKNIFAAAFAIAVILCAHSAYAQASAIGYQGVLVSSGGEVVSDDDYPMIFSIWTTPVGGGAPLWSEQHSNVQTLAGAFDVELGLGTMFDNLFSDQQTVYLEISADLGNGMQKFDPRIPVKAAAFAFHAQNAERLNGQDTGALTADILANHMGSGTDSTIGGGTGNIASGSESTVGGGDSNQATALNATVGGGLQNAGGGLYSTIAGGRLNVTSGQYAAVGGGIDNEGAGNFSTIAGGQENLSTGSESTVGGGRGNEAPGNRSTVGGGGFNMSAGSASTVAGGQLNVAAASRATIGGGDSNDALADYATVAGGNGNTASGENSTVGGGVSNEASELRSTVGGGNSNEAAGQASTVGGGSSNDATGFGSTVGGGEGNQALAEYAVIGGGGPDAATGTPSNRVYDEYGVIGGGAGNIAGIDDGSSTLQGFATVGGGIGNEATEFVTTVGGGLDNAATGPGATIGGGGDNQATGLAATVPGGRDNVAAGSDSFAAGLNCEAQGDYSFALGRNAVASGEGSFCWADSSNNSFTAGEDQFFARASNGFFLSTNATGNIGAVLSANSGSWVAVSDRALKENVEAIDPSAVLEKVAAMPITKWSYKGGEDVRHMGPMGQDFYAAFGLGTDEKGIATIDADGVALAAIQGLNRKVDERDARIAELEAKVHELTQLVESALNTSTQTQVH